MKLRVLFVSLLCSMILSSTILTWADEGNEVPPAVNMPISIQEQIGSRDDHTRVWEYTREVPVTDDETGVTELVTVRNEVFEKADNLCYNRSTTKTPDWVPTVEEISPTSESGYTYLSNQGYYQVGFTGDLTQPWSVVYQVENQQLQLGVR